MAGISSGMVIVHAFEAGVGGNALETVVRAIEAVVVVGVRVKGSARITGHADYGVEGGAFVAGHNSREASIIGGEKVSGEALYAGVIACTELTKGVAAVIKGAEAVTKCVS